MDFSVILHISSLIEANHSTSPVCLFLCSTWSIFSQILMFYFTASKIITSSTILFFLPSAHRDFIFHPDIKRWKRHLYNRVLLHNFIAHYQSILFSQHIVTLIAYRGPLIQQNLSGINAKHGESIFTTNVQR